MVWYKVVQEGEYRDELEGLWIQVNDWVTYVLARHFDLQSHTAMHWLLFDLWRQQFPHSSPQLLGRKRLLDERDTRIECTLVHHPVRRKSWHIEYSDLGPAAGDRFSQLAATDTGHGNIGKNTIDPVGPAPEQANRFLPTPRLEYAIAERHQHPGCESSDHLLIVDDQHGLAIRSRAVVRTGTSSHAGTSVIASGRVEASTASRQKVATGPRR
jgi:hypothetical protein